MIRMSEDKDLQKLNKPQIIYPNVTTWDVLKDYLISTKPQTFIALLVVFGMTVAVVIHTIVIPIYYKIFFDTLASAGDAKLLSQTLFKIVYVVLILNIIEWFAYRLAFFSKNYLGFNMGKVLMQKAFDYLTDHSFLFFSNNFSGSLVQKIGRYGRSYNRIMNTVLEDVVPLIIKIVGSITVLYFVDQNIAIAVMVWAGIFLVSTFIFSKYKLKYDIKGAALDSQVTGTISDAISNHNSVQLFNGHSHESFRVRDIIKKYLDVAIFRWNLSTSLDGFQSLLNVLIEFFIFYYGIKYWEMGFVTLGTFTLVQTYIIYITGSLWGFGRIIRDLYEATADAKQMVEILHLPHEIKDIDKASELTVSNGIIEFKNINFSFGENKPVFNDLSFDIKAGEKVALIGHSGAGKSTLIKLLLRLHDLKSGQILIDGQDISKVKQSSLRHNISLVPQDPALFHRSLYENIRYGKRDATHEQVMEASKMAHCDIFIKEFPNGYETMVGERGVKLSGGERQRVAIARALLKNAPILVLDEATSSLDSHSESLIQDALDTLMKGKTTIVIAHRLSTIKKMDRIIVLGKEGIIEQGSHNDLIKNDKTYSKLWNLQAGGFVDKNVIDELFN